LACFAVICEEMLLDVEEFTFAPAAAASFTSWTHCSRLSTMDEFEHICPTA
jgi:hypothetical protein